MRKGISREKARKQPLSLAEWCSIFAFILAVLAVLALSRLISLAPTSPGTITSPRPSGPLLTPISHRGPRPTLTAWSAYDKRKRQTVVSTEVL